MKKNENFGNKWKFSENKGNFPMIKKPTEKMNISEIKGKFRKKQEIFGKQRKFSEFQFF